MRSCLPESPGTGLRVAARIHASPCRSKQARVYILLRRESTKSGPDLVAVAASGEAREMVVARSPFDETEGQFSRDGKSMAIVSNESGRAEVFVQSFPE